METEKMKQEWKEKKTKKQSCMKCRIWKTTCSEFHPTEDRFGYEEGTYKTPVSKTHPTEDTETENHPTKDKNRDDEVTYKATEAEKEKPKAVEIVDKILARIIETRLSCFNVKTKLL